MPLNIDLLLGVKRKGARTVAQCPACAEAGHDKHAKDHLVIFENGAYACVANPGDKDHRRRIWALAGDTRQKAINRETSIGRTLRRLVRE